VAVASLNRDGFGENLVTGAQVSDKEDQRGPRQLGAYVAPTDFDVQFAFDWIDDKSGVRGAQMLAPTRTALLTPATGPVPAAGRPLRHPQRHAQRQRHQMKGASGHGQLAPERRLGLQVRAAKRESDTETNIDFDTTPDKIADVRRSTATSRSATNSRPTTTPAAVRAA
jgi:iron complex outermembrane receptor protein